VELRRAERSVLDGGDESVPVRRPRHDRGDQRERALGRATTAARRTSGRSRTARPRRPRTAATRPGRHRRPAHVRHDLGGQPVDQSGPLAEPVLRRT
jgi:hypothetical protein